MTLRSQICVSGRRESWGPDPSREVETQDSSVNRAKEGKRDPPCSVVGPFCLTRYENPKGLLFFLPSSVKEASGKFFESGRGRGLLCAWSRGDRKGVDQRIRSREVEVISGDPGVNEGSSKEFSRQWAAISKKRAINTPLEGTDSDRLKEPQDFCLCRIKRKHDATGIPETVERDFDLHSLSLSVSFTVT